MAVAVAMLAAAQPAAAALPKSAVSARKAFFGARNVDRHGKVRRDRVILTWFGVSSLAASFNGHVVLLDTFINNTGPGNCTVTGKPGPVSSPYVRTSYNRLVALRPETIFVGHGHFDHECRTGELIARTGAKLVALPQDCARAADQAAEYAERRRTFRCVPTVTAFSAFGVSSHIKPLGHKVPVTVVRNLHSGPASAPAMNSSGAESLLFRFQVGRFSFVWNDSAGPTRENAPALRTTLRRLAPTDVEFGASLGLGFGQQGFRDTVDYARALRAKAYYALHQDLGSADGSSRSFKAPLLAAFAARKSATKVHWLQDPGDYLRPIVFNPSAARWKR
jgi:hypothetical protein